MVRDISKRTAESGTWVSPTLAVFHQIISQAADVNALLERPQMQYMRRHLTTGAAVGAANFGWYPPDNRPDPIRCDGRPIAQVRL